MSLQDWEAMEKELQRLDPAPLPGPFHRRLGSARPGTAGASTPRLSPRMPSNPLDWSVFWKWALPATAMLALVILGLHRLGQPPKPDFVRPVKLSGLTADQVEIDRQLVNAFEGLAQLSDGQPLRFRCYDWVEHIRVRDSTQGVVFERNEPHREIIPVRYDHD
jgi:hypothetical protein